MISLKGKVAVVTGGSRGIGRAAAIALAKAGADVVFNYSRNATAAKEVLGAIESAGAKGVALRGDVAKFRESRRLVETALKRFGRLDIVVANAGIWEGAPVEALEEKLWDRVIDTNLKSVYAICHFAAPRMKRQGSGTMILVSSTAGQRGEAFYSCYAASKGGIISFAKSICVELGPHGVTVNCVAPGWVDTDMSAEPLRDKKQAQKIFAGIPMGRVATAEGVADAILFLASDLARDITGEVLNVNNGSVLCG